MNRVKILSFSLAAAAMMLAGAQASAGADAKKARAQKGEMILYSGQNFQGDIYELSKARTSISWDFPVGSIAVHPGEKWEICEGARYKAPCQIIDTDTANLGRIVVKSARPVADVTVPVSSD